MSTSALNEARLQLEKETFAFLRVLSTNIVALGHRDNPQPGSVYLPLKSFRDWVERECRSPRILTEGEFSTTQYELMLDFLEDLVNKTLAQPELFDISKFIRQVLDSYRVERRPPVLLQIVDTLLTRLVNSRPIHSVPKAVLQYLLNFLEEPFVLQTTSVCQKWRRIGLEWFMMIYPAEVELWVSRPSAIQLYSATSGLVRILERVIQTLKLEDNSRYAPSRVSQSAQTQSLRVWLNRLPRLGGPGPENEFVVQLARYLAGNRLENTLLPRVAQQYADHAAKYTWAKEALSLCWIYGIGVPQSWREAHNILESIDFRASEATEMDKASYKHARSRLESGHAFQKCMYLRCKAKLEVTTDAVTKLELLEKVARSRFAVYEDQKSMYQAYFDLENYVEALKILQQINKYGPLDREDQLTLSRAYFHNQKYVESINLYKLLAQSMVLDLEDQRKYAHACFNIGDYDQLVALLSTIIASPSDIRMVAISKYHLSLHSEAIEGFERLSHYPEFGIPDRRYLVEAQFKARNYDKVISLLDDLSRVTQLNLGDRRLLARSLYHMGKCEEAYKFYEEIQADSSFNLDDAKHFFDASYRTRNYHQCLQLYERFSAPLVADHRKLAQIHFECRNYTQCLHMYQIAQRTIVLPTPDQKLCAHSYYMLNDPINAAKIYNQICPDLRDLGLQVQTIAERAHRPDVCCCIL